MQHNNAGIQAGIVQVINGTVVSVGPGQMLEHIVQPPSPFADEEDQDDTSVGGIVIPILIALLVLALVALIAVQRDRRRRMALQRSLVMPRIGQRACVCVTDIESSTLQSEHNAAAYAEALIRHNELVRSLANVHNGHELSTEGDSFTLIFHTAADGLAFSLDLQRGLLHADVCPREYTSEGLAGEAAGAKPLAACCEELDQYGSAVLFRGLRVRIGIAAGVLMPSSVL